MKHCKGLSFWEAPRVVVVGWSNARVMLLFIRKRGSECLLSRLQILVSLYIQREKSLNHSDIALVPRAYGATLQAGSCGAVVGVRFGSPQLRGSEFRLLAGSSSTLLSLKMWP